MIRSTSAEGTSSVNRDGSVDWYSPKCRRRAAPVRNSRLSARVMPIRNSRRSSGSSSSSEERE